MTTEKQQLSPQLAEQLTSELVDILTLEKIEEDLFRGKSHNFVGARVFGGQVLGQALRAARIRPRWVSIWLAMSQSAQSCGERSIARPSQ